MAITSTAYQNAFYFHSSSQTSLPQSDEELLKRYLSLSPEQREGEFADTSRVAEITGLSQRTVVNWIREGRIRALRIGKKYQVVLATLHEYLQKAEDLPGLEGVVENRPSKT